MKAKQIEVTTASQPTTSIYEDEGYAELAKQSDFAKEYPTHVAYRARSS